MNIIRIFNNKVKQYGFICALKKLLVKLIYSFTNFGFKKYYYSSQGEDIILQDYYSSRDGFYVDIGAFHPNRYSNTKMFYKKGWRGINIEPNPESIKAFNKVRSRDININIGISDETGELNYYYFGKSDSSNTFDSELYEHWSKQQGRVAKIMKVRVDTLNNILEMNLPKDTEIDFLTIDVEGYEFKILQSLNYDKYSPKFILVEDLDFCDQNKDFMEFRDSKLYKLLNEKGYIVVSKTYYTILFKKVE